MRFHALYSDAVVAGDTFRGAHDDDDGNYEKVFLKGEWSFANVDRILSVKVEKVSRA